MSGRGTGPHGKVKAYIELPPAGGGGGSAEYHRAHDALMQDTPCRYPGASHSVEIKPGVLTVGRVTDLDMGYNKGPTPWKVRHQPTPEPDEQQWPEPHGENF